MKRAIVIFLAAFMCISFACCGKDTESNTDATYLPTQKAEIVYDVENEQMIIATVKQVNGNSLLLVDGNDNEYVFNFSENVKVVKGENYVFKAKASDFAGKKVTVIVSNQIQETWPMGLTGEKFIIINE